MRVLMLHNRYLERGGEDTSFLMDRDLLRSSGNTVVSYVEDNERIKELGSLRTAVQSIWSMDSYRNILRILSENQFDIMHVQNFFPLISPSVYYAAAAKGVPVVQTLRNYRLLCVSGTLSRDGGVCEQCIGKSAPWPGVIKGCYRNSTPASAVAGSMVAINRLMGTWQNKVDAYIALTRFSRNKFVQAGLPAEKIYHKPNSLQPIPEVGPGGGRFALFVGRLTQEKGIETLIRAWRQLPAQIPLKIVGTGPLEGPMQDLAKGSPNIEFLGWRNPPEVMDMLGAADFLVFSSEWYEGCPRVILEAFAKGTPVIGARLGSAAEMIEDESTGYLFRPGDAGDLAATVSKAFSEKTDRGAMRTAARQEFLQQYTDNRNLPRLLEIYRAAIDTKRKREFPKRIGDTSETF